MEKSVDISLRKSVTVAPGLKINLPKSDLSAYVGESESTVNVGHDGVMETVESVEKLEALQIPCVQLLLLRMVEAVEKLETLQTVAKQVAHADALKIYDKRTKLVMLFCTGVGACFGFAMSFSNNAHPLGIQIATGTFLSLFISVPWYLFPQFSSKRRTLK